MDPNLVKITEANLGDIQRGNVKKCILQAEDYLNYVCGHSIQQREKEFQTFISHVKTLRRKARGSRKKQPEQNQEV